MFCFFKSLILYYGKTCSNTVLIIEQSHSRNMLEILYTWNLSLQVVHATMNFLMILCVLTWHSLVNAHYHLNGWADTAERRVTHVMEMNYLQVSLIETIHSCLSIEHIICQELHPVCVAEYNSKVCENNCRHRIYVVNLLQSDVPQGLIQTQ